MNKKYRCKRTSEVRRGGEVVGIGFVAGKDYEQVGWDNHDRIFINEAGGTHIVPASFFKKHFETEPVNQ